MSEQIDREALITGEDMEAAIGKAAEIKKTILTTYKEQDKTNYEQFYETVLHSRPDIVEIMDKKKKNRTDDDERRIKEFKKNTSKTYKMICDMTAKEEVEEGKQTKIEKLVERVALTLDFLRYIGKNDLENEFERRGIRLTTESRLEDKSDVWKDDAVKKNVVCIFDAGRRLVEKKRDDTANITEGIFESDVPQDLVYEKNSNPVGLKKSDWTKLVDIKTKLIMAKVDEQKEKVEDQAMDLAADKQFEQERARLMQIKLLAMESEKSETATGKE